jgi:hypothetical protein
LENNTRTVALQAICSVVLEKKSLSAFVYPEEVSALTKSLVFGTIRFYHQLNDIVSGLLKHSLKKEDLDIHCLVPSERKIAGVPFTPNRCDNNNCCATGLSHFLTSGIMSLFL